MLHRLGITLSLSAYALAVAATTLPTYRHYLSNKRRHATQIKHQQIANKKEQRCLNIQHQINQIKPKPPSNHLKGSTFTQLINTIYHNKWPVIQLNHSDNNHLQLTLKLSWPQFTKLYLFIQHTPRILDIHQLSLKRNDHNNSLLLSLNLGPAADE